MPGNMIYLLLASLFCYGRKSLYKKMAQLKKNRIFSKVDTKRVSLFQWSQSLAYIIRTQGKSIYTSKAVQRRRKIIINFKNAMFYPSLQKVEVKKYSFRHKRNVLFASILFLKQLCWKDELSHLYDGCEFYLFSNFPFHILPLKPSFSIPFCLIGFAPLHKLPSSTHVIESEELLFSKLAKCFRFYLICSQFSLLKLTFIK